MKTPISRFSWKVYDFYVNKIYPVIKKGLDFVFKYTGTAYLYRQYKTKLTVKAQKAISGYCYILPWLIGLVLFGLQPIIKSVRMALSDFSGLKAIAIGDTAKTVFIIDGFSSMQFNQIFGKNPEHVEAIITLFGNTMLVVPLVLVFSLLLALLLNRKIKGIKIFRTIFFIPVILLSGNLINYLNRYDLLTVPILTGNQVHNFIDFYLPGGFAGLILQAFAKVVLILWLGGVQTLIFLAGLQKVNRPIYEAAAIDGASAWEMFWKITFPALFPLMMINVIYTTVIYANLDNPLSAIIERTIAAPDYGRDYASALAWVLFGIEIFVIGFYLLLLKLANKRYQ
ncbi:MAG: sugar ABC transporter permease [Bacilli bacterium]|nr:sugar ABC transporter permease [Bacilli bacterium]MDD4389117.1 sugar ABC transporter permease [Bacilli bacterium]